MLNHDPKTPVSMLGLSPAEAKRERQRRSHAALTRILKDEQPLSLEERVESLERAVLRILNQLDSGN